MFKDLLYIALGGGFGSALRYLVSKFIIRFAHGAWMFAGTMTVNIVGSLLIGLLSGWMLSHQPDNQAFRLLFIVGFCGGFTTFSTFAFENLRLIEQQQWVLLAFYIIGSIVLGVAAVWFGMRLVR